MNKFDVVIIGGGLGGLLCGNILSREGLSVCIIEKNNKIGGCIQSFAKNKTIFNTGLNYTESLGKDEVLYQYFKYFQIIDKLKIQQLDTNAFEKISFEGDENEYPFAQGADNFVDTLSEYFPKEKQNLKKYINTLNEVCQSSIFYSFETTNHKSTNDYSLITKASEFLKKSTPDKKLQQILGGMNSLYAGVENKTPLYMHALINYSFIKSAWRLIDGSSQLASSISKVITNNGGIIMRSSKVISISGENSEIEYVELDNKEKILAKKIISNLHPSTTLKLVEQKFNKKAFQERVNSLDNTIGMFSLYIVLKKDKFPYINFNHHHFSETNVWTTNYDEKKWPEHYMLYTPASSKSNKWADGLIVMTYMNYNDVKKWENSTLENRGDEYLEFKEKKAELLIDFIEKKFPDIRNNIECYYSSTPLTYRDYTGTPGGSSYGILKDADDPLATIIPAKSRIKNLLFTGQNLNMHGILGVSISAVLTCSEILGFDYLFDKIKKA
ncbi:MAG: NAD(P)-binding protein [Bacteroidota bacterium]